MRTVPQSPDVIGSDPLDHRLGFRQPAPAPRSRWLRSRLALGLSPTPGPAVLLLMGLALGPQGLRLFSAELLGYVDPIVATALAALGVLVGLGLDLRRPGETRLLGAASIEAGLTVLLVGAGLAGLARVQPIAELSTWTVALILGVCAATSSTALAGETIVQRLAARIGDLDDILPILLGGVVLALMYEISTLAALLLVLQIAAVALAVSIGGWLLVARSASDAEQRVFAVGAILVLAGVAEALSSSALLTGLTAGVFWGTAGGEPRERVARDVRHMQHPLLVVLLLTAGARMRFTMSIAIAAVAFVALRFVAKAAGGWLVTRMVRPRLPASFGLLLLSPGVIGVAFALNAALAGGGSSGFVLSVAVAATVISELLALITQPRTSAS